MYRELHTDGRATQCQVRTRDCGISSSCQCGLLDAIAGRAWTHTLYYICESLVTAWVLPYSLQEGGDVLHTRVQTEFRLKIALQYHSVSVPVPQYTRRR